jgi:hypothetical protein
VRPANRAEIIFRFLDLKCGLKCSTIIIKDSYVPL